MEVGSRISWGESLPPRLGADTLGKAQVAQVAFLWLPEGAILGGPWPRGQCSDPPSAPAKARATFRGTRHGRAHCLLGAPCGGFAALTAEPGTALVGQEYPAPSQGSGSHRQS